MCWILDTFPHNGFNPPFGDCWRQNEVDHCIEGLIIASYYLKDYDLKLARECKWLAERMFEYGRNHSTKAESLDIYEITSKNTLMKTDEGIWTPQDVIKIADYGAADIINIKIAKSCGLALGKKIETVAEAAGLPCIVGTKIERASH